MGVFRAYAAAGAPPPWTAVAPPAQSWVDRQPARAEAGVPPVMRFATKRPSWPGRCSRGRSRRGAGGVGGRRHGVRHGPGAAAEAGGGTPRPRLASLQAPGVDGGGGHRARRGGPAPPQRRGRGARPGRGLSPAAGRLGLAPGGRVRTCRGGGTGRWPAELSHVAPEVGAPPRLLSPPATPLGRRGVRAREAGCGLWRWRSNKRRASVGLDQYEVRRRDAWHRHVTLGPARPRCPGGHPPSAAARAPRARGERALAPPKGLGPPRIRGGSGAS